MFGINFLPDSKERKPKTHVIFLNPETMRGHGFREEEFYPVKVIRAHEEGGRWAEGDIYIRESGTRLRLNAFSRNQDIQEGDTVRVREMGEQRR